MARSNRSVRSRSPAICAGLASALSFSAEAAFHVTFGTTGDPDDRNADNAAFVIETSNGDLIVAGAGASRWSDDGIRDRNVPLIARIDANGVLQWQRVYDALENHSVAALLDAGEELHVLVKSDTSSTPAQSAAIRRIDRSGNLAVANVGFTGLAMMHAVTVEDANPPYFLVAARTGFTWNAAAGTKVQLFQLHMQGRFGTLKLPADVHSIDHLLHLGAGDFLVVPSQPMTVVLDPATYQARSDVLRMSMNGNQQKLFTLVDKQCHHVVALQDRIVCAEYSALGRGQFAVVAYSLGGQEFWRHELAPGADPVRQLAVLDSGAVVYTVENDRGTEVVGLDPAGRQAWRQTVRSTGERTFVSAIVRLRNGRIAFLGRTGPWNGFVSTDTDAMLLVVDGFGADLASPPIVSSVNAAR